MLGLTVNMPYYEESLKLTRISIGRLSLGLPGQGAPILASIPSPSQLRLLPMVRLLKAHRLSHRPSFIPSYFMKTLFSQVGEGEELRAPFYPSHGF